MENPKLIYIGLSLWKLKWNQMVFGETKWKLPMSFSELYCLSQQPCIHMFQFQFHFFNQFSLKNVSIARSG